MTTYYMDKSNPSLGGYTIYREPTGGWRWSWHEAAMGDDEPDLGKPRESEAEALLDAASDWEYNGDSSNRRFAGMLRGIARRKAATERPDKEVPGD